MAVRIPMVRHVLPTRDRHPNSGTGLPVVSTTEQPVVMVQVGESGWTTHALHAACRWARARHAAVAIVVMVPVQHLSWLGSEVGTTVPTEADMDRLEDCLATVEDYGLEAEVVRFQYTTWLEGTLQAAEYAEASVVYAEAPTATWPTWRRVLAWSMRRQLNRQGRVWVCEPDRATLPQLADLR